MKPLTVPYKVFPEYGSYACSAVLNVQIALPTKNSPRTKRFEAVIDSGASRCLFHADFARYLAIDLSACPIEVTQGIGGYEDTFLHELMLYVPGGPVVITAGFKERLPVAGLLGMAGFFEHFNITFNAAGQFCTLERLYKT